MVLVIQVASIYRLHGVQQVDLPSESHYQYSGVFQAQKMKATVLSGNLVKKF
jgi:hypothetical protein